MILTRRHIHCTICLVPELKAFSKQQEAPTLNCLVSYSIYSAVHLHFLTTIILGGLIVWKKQQNDDFWVVS